MAGDGLGFLNYKPKDQANDEPGFMAYQPKPESHQNAFTDTVKDVGVGVERIPGALAGLADIPAGLAGLNRPFSRMADAAGEVTGFTPGKWADETTYSPERQQANKNVQQAWDANDKGDKSLLGAVGETLANPRALAGSLVQSVPSMFVGGGLGRAAMGAKSLSAPFVGEGAIMAGQQMDTIGDAVDPQKAALASLATGAGGAALSRLGGKISERAGLVDPDAVITNGLGAATSKAPLSLPRRLAGGFLAEGALEELPQSVLEQGLQNYSEDKPITQGMGRAATEGLIGGGLMGAGFNALSGRPAQDKPSSWETPSFTDTKDGRTGPYPQWETPGYQPMSGQTQPLDLNVVAATGQPITDDIRQSAEAGGVLSKSVMAGAKPAGLAGFRQRPSAREAQAEREAIQNEGNAPGDLFDNSIPFAKTPSQREEIQSEWDAVESGLKGARRQAGLDAWQAPEASPYFDGTFNNQADAERHIAEFGLQNRKPLQNANGRWDLELDNAQQDPTITQTQAPQPKAQAVGGLQSQESQFSTTPNEVKNVRNNQAGSQTGNGTGKNEVLSSAARGAQPERQGDYLQTDSRKDDSGVGGAVADAPRIGNDNSQGSGFQSIPYEGISNANKQEENTAARSGDAGITGNGGAPEQVPSMRVENKGRGSENTKPEHFQPTHTLSDGTPVRWDANENGFVDAQGAISDPDGYEIPLQEPANARNIPGSSATNDPGIAGGKPATPGGTGFDDGVNGAGQPGVFDSGTGGNADRVQGRDSPSDAFAGGALSPVNTEYLKAKGVSDDDIGRINNSFAKNPGAIKNPEGFLKVLLQGRYPDIDYKQAAKNNDQSQNPAPQASATEEAVIHNQGPHYAAGYKAAVDGGERILPSYFTKPNNKNAKDWFRGYDRGIKQPSSTQPTNGAESAENSESQLNERNSFSVTRVEGDKESVITFKRGERVKIAGSHPMKTGVIVGISQAKKEAKIGGVWRNFGYIYKADYDEFAAPRKILADQIAKIENRLNDDNPIEALDLIREAKKQAKAFGTDADLARLNSLDIKRSKVERDVTEKYKRQIPEPAPKEEPQPDTPIQMTMKEWLKIHKDFKGKLADGARSVLRDGRMRSVEIVKEKPPTVSNNDEGLPVSSEKQFQSDKNSDDQSQKPESPVTDNATPDETITPEKVKQTEANGKDNASGDAENELADLFKSLGKSGLKKSSEAKIKDHPKVELIRAIQKHWADVLADHGFETEHGAKGRLTNTIEIKC